MENNSLRIKFSHGDTAIELEGDAKTVLSELNSIKEQGIGRVADIFASSSKKSTGASIVSSEEQRIEKKENLSETTVNGELAVENFPSIKELIYKDLPKSDTEWSLIYSYLASNAGEKPFTQDGIWEQYEQSGRDTKNRKKNLNYYIKQVIRNNWWKSLNEDQFLLISDGIQKVKEIVSRDPISNNKKKIKKRTPVQNSHTSNNQVVAGVQP